MAAYDTKFQKRRLASSLYDSRSAVHSCLEIFPSPSTSNRRIMLSASCSLDALAVNFSSAAAHVRGVETPVGVGVHVLERDGLAELTPAPSTQVTHDENLERDAVRGKRGAGHGPGFDAELSEERIPPPQTRESHPRRLNQPTSRLDRRDRGRAVHRQWKRRCLPGPSRSKHRSHVDVVVPE